MKLEDIYEHLANELQEIEERLAASIDTDEAELRASSLHLLHAGGKRMRPIFVLLAGRLGNYQRESLLQVAVALELIHMATLVHDDVIDDADRRRGRKTVKSAWDNRVAMYTGDFIISRALQQITQIEALEVHRSLSRAIFEMCKGEIDQIQDLYCTEQSLKRYLHRIKRKTALLMAISCKLGAMVSQAPPALVHRMHQYGYYVGMAFQLTDDVLDIRGDEKVIGKPAGGDLRQGNVTLPVIYALKNGETEKREKLLTYLTSQGQEGELKEILAFVQSSGGVEYTLDLSRRYYQKAIQALDPLPNSLEKKSLQLLAEFIVERSY